MPKIVQIFMKVLTACLLMFHCEAIPVQQMMECPHPDSNRLLYNEKSRELKCDTGDKEGQLYHCVFAGGLFIERCHNVFGCGKGTFLTIDSTGDLACEVCLPGTFYRSSRKSNKALICLPKSPCDDFHHEQVCYEGDSTEDRNCSCMFRLGYKMNVMQPVPDLNCCSRTSSSPCRCDSVNCKTNEELDSAYHCVPKCSLGYFRSEDKCIPTITITERPVVGNVTVTTSVIKDLTTTVKPITTTGDNKQDDDGLPTSNVNNLKDEIVIGIVIGIVTGIFIILFGIVIFLAIKTYRKKKATPRPRAGNQQAGAPNERDGLNDPEHGQARNNEDDNSSDTAGAPNERDRLNDPEHGQARNNEVDNNAGNNNWSVVYYTSITNNINAEQVQTGADSTMNQNVRTVDEPHGAQEDNTSDS